MKVIIAGGRTHTQYATVLQAVQESGFKITLIIEGGCSGTDRLARQYADKNSIPYRTLEANWKQYGLNAGPIRNRQMVREADALIALWDGASRGTGNCIKEAQKKGIKVFIFKIPRPKESRGRPRKT